MLPFPLHLSVALPDWVSRAIDGTVGFPDDETRMRLAIRLARENVIRATGGPFGAAIFEAESGRLAGVGVNLVVPLHNSCLHAEMVAFMTAQAAAGTYSLAAAGLPAHELYTSCEPCAMCLGASLWSGVKRIVWAATREDADRLSFDEGPVFASSYKYLRRRGISFAPEVLRAEAQEVFALYTRTGGKIYNA
jgi:tRNA(Arg) A34 adenosine deaminase TadA